MKGPQLLFDHQDRLATRMGGWFPGQRVVFRGKDLHVDLKDIDWLDLYVYGITGHRFTKEQIRVLHAIWTFTSYPDPRLWNNRVAAAAGSARSTGHLAISGAIAVSEASIYGGKPVIRAIDFLLRTKLRLDAGDKLGELVRDELRACRGIAGYGRPIAKSDERVPHLLKLADEVGLHRGAHLKLALDVDQFLLEGGWRMRMNYAALIGGLAADMGFTAREFYLFTTLVFVAGMLPCLVEAFEKPEGTFLPMTCDRIAYSGTPGRAWV
jgi:citrate synthase